MRNEKGQFVKGHTDKEPKPYWSKEWLIQEYVEKKRNMNEIAKQFNVWPNTIKSFLIKFSIQTRGISEENNYAWKGENVSYRNLHTWVQRKLGKPNTCEKCKKKQIKPHSIHWANKSGNYKREISDWLRLCVSCHRKMDFSRRPKKKKK